jgi:ABC-2 type transport system permease protein
MSGGVPSLTNIYYFLILVVSGTLVIYSLWIVLIALTFWFIKFDNNVTILQALMDSGRYPAMIYPPWLRLIVTYLIPIAIATTVPVQGLRGDLTGLQVLIFVSVGVITFWIATRILKAGIRQYSGASS